MIKFGIIHIRDSISYLISCIFSQMIDGFYLNISLHRITYFSPACGRKNISKSSVQRVASPATLLSLDFTIFLVISMFTTIDVYMGWARAGVATGADGYERGREKERERGVAAAWSRENHVLRSRTLANDTDCGRARDFVRGPTVRMPCVQSRARATYRRVAYPGGASRSLPRRGGPRVNSKSVIPKSSGD